MPKRLKAILLIAGNCVFATGLYLGYRNKAMDRLYVEAVSLSGESRTAQDPVGAVKKLATYFGTRPKRMLHSIALGNTLTPDAQTAAVSALAGRRDPDIGTDCTDLSTPVVHPADSVTLDFG